ncbi:MAG TPA: PAS domain S-box protein [Beijerinckiaceae bacterium]|nr:PAS domain S-box protein [Beijerinckiaceae bacterium]
MAVLADHGILAALVGAARGAALERDERATVVFDETGAPRWASPSARSLFGSGMDGAVAFSAAAPGAQRLKAFIRAADSDRLAEPLRFFIGGRLEPLPVQALRLTLADGTPGLVALFGEGPALNLPDPEPKKASEPASAVQSPLPQPAVEQDGARKTQRFVFLTDAEGAISSVSPVFTQALGIHARDLVGRNFVDVIAEIDPVRAGDVARAMLAATTWNGICVDWPMADGTRTLPVEFSAMPAFDASRALTGFNGFGLIRFERPANSATASPAVPAPEPALPVSETAPATTDNDFEAAIRRLEAILGDVPHHQQDARPTPDASSGTAAGKHLAPRPEGRPLPSPAPPADDASVVPLPSLKTHVGATLGEPKVVPLKPNLPPASGAQNAGLSHSERNAFREIAKALGARIETTPVGGHGKGKAAPLTPQTQTEVPPNRVAEAQAELSKALGVPPAMAAGAQQPSAGFTDLLLERMPLGVLVFRGDKPLYLNRTLLDLTGYDTLAEFDALKGLEKLFRGRAAPGLVTGEFDTVTIMGRDGATLPVDAHLQSIDWQGEHATLVTIRRAQDAEDGPRAKALDLELKKRQAELGEAQAMLDTATDGVVSLDDGGRILALNKSAEALFGYDQNELTGERLTLLLAPESHAAALDYLDGLKSGGVASVLNDGREVIGRERKGGRIPLFMTIGRISDTGKFAAVVRDMTAWKRAEAELTEAKRAAERSSALKSDFLAKVSHEIRTPMNAIIGFAEVMRDERLGPIGTERYKDYLNDIHTSGTHVISLVNDLLDLSKIEAGRMELTFASVDLNAIVTSCLGIMQPQANRDRVIMRSQLSAKLPPVVADERSLRQIVLNLLSNASKFTEPGGQVIVSTALTDQGEAVIRVRDTGVGMTEQEIQAALEPFRQLSNARGRGGTGLGLPLTKALVEANRASFVINSKVREGTLVEITFPPTRVLAE